MALLAWQSTAVVNAQQSTTVCSSDTDHLDLDFRGGFDFEETWTSCLTEDPVLGVSQTSSYTSRSSNGSAGWTSLDDGIQPFGVVLDSPHPSALQRQTQLGLLRSAGLAGLSLVQSEGGIRYGWISVTPIQSFNARVEMEFADRTNDPVVLGVPPGRAWTPTLSGRGFEVPLPSATARAAGIVRTFRTDSVRFEDGLCALNVDAGGRIWAVGIDRIQESNVQIRTATLFRVDEDGGNLQRELQFDPGVFQDFEIAFGSGGAVFLHSPSNPRSVLRYDPATRSTNNLRPDVIPVPLLSRLAPLSEGRLCASTARGFILLDRDGSRAEWKSLENLGLSRFNRGAVESPNGWLYFLAQDGGAGDAGGIARCRLDGTEASRWLDYPQGFRKGGLHPALQWGPDGKLYGYRYVDGRIEFYRLSESGDWEGLGETVAMSSCSPNRFGGGYHCTTYGPFRAMFRGWTDGGDGALYGILEEPFASTPQIASVIQLDPRRDAGGPDNPALIVNTRTSALNGPAHMDLSSPWVRSPSGVLFGLGQEGIVSYRPGHRGVRTIRTIRQFNSVSDFPAGPLVRDGSGRIFGITRSGGVVNEGTLFLAREDGTQAAVLHSFTGSEGNVMNPSGFIAFGDDGWLYGASLQGSRFDFVPKLFRVHPDRGEFEVMAPLPGRFDGNTAAVPGLMRSRTGVFYGTTPRGGQANLGTVFRFDPSNRQVTVLHEFGSNDDDRWRAWPELIEGRDGMIYGLAGGDSTNQVAADGLFRLDPVAGEYRILSWVPRVSPGLRLSGGLTETSDGSLWAVRAGSPLGTPQTGVIGELIQFARATDPNAPTRSTIVFSNEAGQEPFLRPSGRLVELPDGRLLGLGSDPKTVAYTWDSVRGTLERVARSGLGDLALLEAIPRPLASPILLGNGRVLAAFTGSEGQVRSFKLTRPEATEAGPQAPVKLPYGSPIQLNVRALLFRNVEPAVEVVNRPASISATDLAYGLLSGSLDIGRHEFTVIASDGFWPPRRVTNTITLEIQPLPVLFKPRDKSIAIGNTNLNVTGTVSGLLVTDGITVTWTTEATSNSPAGQYAIHPVIHDPLGKFANYSAATNAAWLRILEPKAVPVLDPEGFVLRFPAIPGLLYEIEGSDDLSGTWRPVTRFWTPSAIAPHWDLRLEAPDLYRFYRITPQP